MWAEHHASPLMGIRVRQGGTQISRLHLWSLIKGVAVYSNCLFFWLFGGFYLREEQFLWEEAAVEERGEKLQGAWILGVFSGVSKVRMEVRDLEISSLKLSCIPV